MKCRVAVGCLCSLALVAGGCASSMATKTVTVQAEPAGSTVTIRRLDDAGLAGEIVPGATGRTPFTVALPVDQGQRYVAVATAPQHLPASVDVERDPATRTTYELDLRRHLADSAQYVPSPQRRDGRWTLDFEREVVPAYVLDADEGLDPSARDSVERSLAVSRVTSNDDLTTDLRSPAASPAGGMLLVQRVDRTPAAEAAILPGLSEDGRDGPTLAQVAADYETTPRAILEANPPARNVDDLYKLSRVRVPTLGYRSFLYRQPLGPGLPSRLTEYRDAREFDPAFAPDGRRAIYATTANSPNAQLVDRAVGDAGTLQGRLTSGLDLDWHPSAGGEYVVFNRVLTDSADALPELWRSGPRGEGSLARGVESPALDAGGDRIVFVEPVALGTRVVRRLGVMRSDGSERGQLTANDDYDVRDPAWSSDGTLVAFAADGPEPPRPAPAGSFGGYSPFGDDPPVGDAPANFDLYVGRYSPATGLTDVARLTDDLSHDDSPTFGPDGTLYFRSNRGGVWNVWRLTLPAGLATGP